MTDLRCSGNLEVELGRGRHDFGVRELFFSGVKGSDGSRSRVEKDARDAGCRRPEKCDAAEAELKGDERSSEQLDSASSAQTAEPTTAGEDILRRF